MPLSDLDKKVIMIRALFYNIQRSV